MVKVKNRTHPAFSRVQGRFLEAERKRKRPAAVWSQRGVAITFEGGDGKKPSAEFPAPQINQCVRWSFLVTTAYFTFLAVALLRRSRYAHRGLISLSQM
jgi:hypothetical protein